MLAERFPRPDLAPRVVELHVKEMSPPAPERFLTNTSPDGSLDDTAAASSPMSPIAEAPALRIQPEESKPGRTMPLSPGRFGLQLTMPEETHELWRRLEDLLAPEVPRGDYVRRLHLALEALVEKREKRRFGRTASPRKARPSKNPDYIPAAVKREVCERDGGQCTFESASGKRCEKRGDLQYDHIRPKACGGKSTVDNLRLRCFAHNQLEAERTFGAGFMEAKRAQARLDRAPHPS